MKQQTLFEEKVAELASSAHRICLLEDSVTKHLAKQRDLDDQLKVMLVGRCGMGWDVGGAMWDGMGWEGGMEWYGSRWMMVAVFVMLGWCGRIGWLDGVVRG